MLDIAVKPAADAGAHLVPMVELYDTGKKLEAKQKLTPTVHPQNYMLGDTVIPFHQLECIVGSHLSGGTVTRADKYQFRSSVLPPKDTHQKI